VSPSAIVEGEFVTITATGIENAVRIEFYAVTRDGREELQAPKSNPSSSESYTLTLNNTNINSVRVKAYGADGMSIHLDATVTVTAKPVIVSCWIISPADGASNVPYDRDLYVTGGYENAGRITLVLTEQPSGREVARFAARDVGNNSFGHPIPARYLEPGKRYSVYAMETSANDAINVHSFTVAATLEFDANEFWRSRADAGWVYPIDSGIYSLNFNASRSNGTRSHAGIDLGINAGAGTRVFAMESGTVIDVNINYYAGTDAVVIEHGDGTIAVYAEIAVYVRKGETVQRGALIGSTKAFNGTQGSTRGNQMLHLEVYLGRDRSGRAVTGSIIGANSNTYHHVTPRHGGTFGRRADLIDPSGVRMLSSIRTLSLAEVPDTLAYNNDALIEPLLNIGTASIWAQESLQNAHMLGLIPTRLQDSYTQAITRAEFTALAVALYETVTGREITERMFFVDTNDVNVQKMGALGVIVGVGNNRFSPNDTLTREQAAVILTRLAEVIGKPLPPMTATFADNANISSWAIAQVGKVQGAGIMSGVGNNSFAPQSTYTREQSIVTILRLFDILE
jgi:murein DD-endopeptidase MepM/ murein hydrolase activator NlpD